MNQASSSTINTDTSAALQVFGIANCDTLKKACNWLKAHQIPFAFHDYRKDGLDSSWLEIQIRYLGWPLLINRRGTSWRNLTPALRLPLEQALNDKTTDDAQIQSAAIQAMLAQPALIRRPLVIDNQGHRWLGFSEDDWTSRLIR